MELATLRIHDTEVISLDCPRVDAARGAKLVELIAQSVARGVRFVVLDFGPGTVFDFAGARAISLASDKLGKYGRLSLAGLSGRARAMLRSVRVANHVHMVECWTDAVDPEMRAEAA